MNLSRINHLILTPIKQTNFANIIEREESRDTSDSSFDDNSFPSLSACSRYKNKSSNNPTCFSTPAIDNDLDFSARILHFCNLNIQHLLPKMDEVRLLMANDNCPDIFGFCETFINQTILDIRKTCPCNEYPLKPHFYIVKLGYVGVYLFFLFLLQNIDCGYSLESPRRGGSNVYPQSMI